MNPQLQVLFNVIGNEFLEGDCMVKILGFEVNKPFKILIKTSITIEFIESNIQNTKAPRTNNPII